MDNDPRLAEFDEAIAYVEARIKASEHLPPEATEGARKQLALMQETRAKYIAARDAVEATAEALAAVLPSGEFIVLRHTVEYPPDGPIQVEEVPVTFEPIFPKE